jgi:glycosyltransferase involved in cell wall biosynthesis
MDRGLRLVHVIDKSRLTTGSVVQLLEAARGLHARGHTVTVAGPVGGDLGPACAASGLPYLDLRFRGLADPTSVVALRRHLRRLEPQVLHVHKGGAHFLGILAATGCGKLPRLVVNRGVSFHLDRFNRWKYRHPRVAAIVCVADAVKTVVVRSGGLREDHVHTIHGGTDCSTFDPARIDRETIRRELGLEPQHLLVGQVSVRDWKGWSDLLAAFARVAPRMSGLRLMLVGCEPPSEQRKVEKAVREAALGDRVTALPFRTDMPEVLSACDVVVDASWTGTGVTGTIREAMAMERAVVATDCGGNRELVSSDEVGLLVPPRDVDALAAALIRLLDDPTLRQELGAAARQRVVGHFSTEQRIEKLEALYRRII